MGMPEIIRIFIGLISIKGRTVLKIFHLIIYGVDNGLQPSPSRFAV